jgi:signal transduction histidine kinase
VEQRTSELAKTNRCLEETLAQLKESRIKELQVERQAAIGALAAGMAHEMNNPLHAVSVSVQGLKEDLQSSPEYGPFIANIERSTKRCRRIIGEILSFSRESKSSLANLPEIISAAVDTFKSEHPASLTLELQIPPDLPKILLDAAQIRQALVNLLMNASDAMGGQGLIRVGVEREASTVVISVTDSGPGMTGEVKSRIFDPFFTTKQKGMGLGLSITWQLVQKNGGAIEVESQVGLGTTFRIRMPIPGETL